MRTGYAIVASRLSAWFRRYGHEVDVITEGRGCYRIGKVAFLDETGRNLFNRDHDIVQVIGPTPFFSEQCVRSAKKKGLPVVYTMNAFPGLSSYYHNPMSGLVDSLYKKFNLYRKIRDVDLMVFHTNEFAKYVANAFLATKISYFNEVQGLCKSLGVSPEAVSSVAALDRRIGSYGTIGGKPFRGKCLPKDVEAFLTFARNLGIRLDVLKAAVSVNQKEPLRQYA